ncbi:MAG: acyl-CoA dehydrogenase family protein [Myxococcota bacterium]|nr:acyl-CoA dehydrogenase family protein [Myxococcota bacterium]
MSSNAEIGRSDLSNWREQHPNNYFTANHDAQRTMRLRLGLERYEQVREHLEHVGALAAGPMARLGRDANREENLPRLERYSGIGTRTEEVVFHPSYHELGRHIWSSGVLSQYGEKGRETEQLAMMHMFSQNGELGHLCPLACTAGLIKLLQAVGTESQQKRWLPGLLAKDYDQRIHASQFLTEVQGGSDVGANAVQAVKTDDHWQIQGEKWFCSVIDASVFLMTARPEDAAAGTKGLSLFLVPRNVDGQTNEFYIRRLKWKLGTRAMASAEVDFRGASAEAIGETGKGFKNIVENVLDTSRLYNAICCAGAIRRSFLEASRFAQNRRAFGVPIARYPLIQEAIATLRAESMATFAITQRLSAQGDLLLTGQGDEDLRSARRVGNNINKYWTSVRNTQMARLAMEVFGGNGAIESFSIIPQLYRDAMVLESWEGTHNTLVQQVMRDSQRYRLHEAFLTNLTESTKQLELLSDHESCRSAILAGIDATRQPLERIADGDNDQRWGRRIVDQLAVCQALVSLLEELSMSSQDKACRAAIDFFVTRDLRSSIDKPPPVSQALYSSES